MWTCVTWFGALIHGSVPDLVCELGPVVVHIDDINNDVDGVLHLVPIDVHSVST